MHPSTRILIQSQVLLAAAVCFAIPAPAAMGQCAEELRWWGPVIVSQFGRSVAVSEDTAVVGADGLDVGTADVFVRSEGVWTLQQNLTALDAADNDGFGYSVSVSGDTAVVGAHFNDDAGSSSGSAYVFVRLGNTWTQQQKLTASDAAAGDQFGQSVSVSGDTVVVGADFDDDAGSNSGSAYVFVRLGNTWTQQQKLTASDAAAGDLFGQSVSVSGDTVMIGAWGNDDAGNSSGSAYVFVRSGGTWTQQQKLTASDAAAGANFGVSVSVNGDTAVVGAPEHQGTRGSAYVFGRNGGVWTQQQKLTASDAELLDRFGKSVSVDGDTAVVGAYTDSAVCTACGSAYVFARSGGVWTQQQKLTPSIVGQGGYFGSSVSVSGDTAMIGAWATGIGHDSGVAYIFQCAEFCFPPNCSNHGTCDNGTCICTSGFTGAGCDQCAQDYYNYPTCAFCQASTTCSGHGSCNALGGCNCSTGYAGAGCNQCGSNYYNYPTCTFCQAATTCSGHGTCNALGGCNCSTGYAEADCNQCGPNYYSYPTCIFCQAATTCTGNGTCNGLGGCDCNTGFVDAACDQCGPDYYNYPTCTFCLAGSTCSGNGTCNVMGGCDCDTGWIGLDCATPEPAIPTVSQWGVVVMALLTLTSGTVVYRRRTGWPLPSRFLNGRVQCRGSDLRRSQRAMQRH